MTQASEIIRGTMPDFERMMRERQAANAEVVGECAKHGPYTRGQAVPTANGLMCPECNALEVTRQERQRMLSNFLEGSGVPLRFQRFRMEDFNPPSPVAGKVFGTVKKYAETFPEHLKAGRCLVMCGRTGTGKTMLACAAALHIAVEHGKLCRYTTAYHIVRDIKDTYGGQSGRTERDIVRALVEPDLLIVDEIGVQHGTDTEKLLLFEVLNGRYESMKPTVVVSNEEPGGIAAYLGDRVMDRLAENGGAMLVFDWQSHRGKL